MRRLIARMKALLEYLGFFIPPSYTLAKGEFQRLYPHAIVLELRRLAKETSADIIAVIYAVPGTVSYPHPYKVFRVRDDNKCAQEIVDNGDSPYWIRDYK